MPDAEVILIALEIGIILVCLLFAACWVIYVTGPDNEFKKECLRILVEAETIKPVKVTHACKSVKEFDEFDPRIFMSDLVYSGKIKKWIPKIEESAEQFESIWKQFKNLDREDVSNETINTTDAETRNFLKEAVPKYKGFTVIWTLSRHDGRVIRKSRTFSLVSIHNVVRNIEENKRDFWNGNVISGKMFRHIWPVMASNDRPGCYVIFLCNNGTPKIHAETSYRRVYIGASEDAGNMAYEILEPDAQGNVLGERGIKAFLRIIPCNVGNFDKMLDAIEKKYSMRG